MFYSIVFSLLVYSFCDDKYSHLDPKNKPLLFAIHMAVNNYKYETAYEMLSKYEAYKAYLEAAAANPPYIIPCKLKKKKYLFAKIYLI